MEADFRGNANQGVQIAGNCWQLPTIAWPALSTPRVSTSQRAFANMGWELLAIASFPVRSVAKAISTAAIYLVVFVNRAVIRIGT